MHKYYGKHVAVMMLEHRATEIDSVYIRKEHKDKRLSQIERLAAINEISVVRYSTQELNEVADGNRHQGVVLISQHKSRITGKPTFLRWISQRDTVSLLVALDGILDPRNLGACLRSANAAGASGVIISRNRGCSITSTVSRTAAGAAETTAIYEASNLVRTLEQSKDSGYRVVGLDSKAERSIYELNADEPIVLVFGTEDKGLRASSCKVCDELVNIPMMGTVPSINVSVAVGVGSFEVMRQLSVAQLR